MSSEARWARIVLQGVRMEAAGEGVNYTKLAAACGVSRRTAKRAWDRREELSATGKISRRKGSGRPIAFASRTPIKNTWSSHCGPRWSIVRWYSVQWRSKRLFCCVWWLRKGNTRVDFDFFMFWLQLITFCLIPSDFTPLVLLIEKREQSLRAAAHLSSLAV